MEKVNDYKAEHAYTPQCLEALRQQEAILQYERFGSAEALSLGNIAAKLALEYDRGVGLRITREKDALVLFQYMMDDKAERNLGFMEAKRRAALKSGHCSLWPYVEHEINGAWRELIDAVPDVLPCGGAFPIRAGGEWVATIAVSGLHEGKDHELAVRALSEALKRSVPPFPGALV